MQTLIDIAALPALVTIGGVVTLVVVNWLLEIVDCL